MDVAKALSETVEKVVGNRHLMVNRPGMGNVKAKTCVRKLGEVLR
jgi:hypothetical protein